MLTATLNRNSRRLGVEFEFAVPQVGAGQSDDVRKTLAQVLSANGVPSVVRGYSHRPVPAGADVCIEYDASVRGESRYRGIRWVSVEAKTRILSGLDDWEQVVPKMLDIVRYLGGRVNTSCGHHVHVELEEALSRPAVVRSLYNAIHRYESVIYSILPPSRRSGHYSQPMPDISGRLAKCRTLRCMQRGLESLPRHSGTNWNHLFGPSPRVEYRYAASTLNVEKARQWARFLLRLTDHAVVRNCKATKAQLPPCRESVVKMATSIGLKPNSKVYSTIDPELRETGRWLTQRWEQFQPVSI